MQTWKTIAACLAIIACHAPDAAAREYFDGVVSGDLEPALKKARDKDMPIFMVVYDSKNPTKSNLDYSLGYFLQYKTTKDLVKKSFVQLLVRSLSRGIQPYIPKDDPLENCLLVIIAPDGKALVTEGVYANPDEGMKRVQSYIEKWEKYKKERDNQKQDGKPVGPALNPQAQLASWEPGANAPGTEPTRRGEPPPLKEDVLADNAELVYTLPEGQDFQKKVAQFLSKFNTAQNQLGKTYLAALDALASRVQSLADLQGAVAVKEEKARFDNQRRVTPTDISSHDGLKSLQTQHLKKEARMHEQFAKGISTMAQTAIAALQRVQDENTKAGKIEDALAVRKEIVTIRTEAQRMVASATAASATIASATAAASEITDDAAPVDSRREQNAVTQQSEQQVRGTISSPSGNGFIIKHESINNATDGNPDAKWCTHFSDQKDIIWQLELINSVIVSQYALTSANDDPEADPYRWTFEGSNDGNKWTTLDTQRRSKGFSLRHQKCEFKLDNKLPFKKYRFVFKPGSSVSKFQIGEIEIANLELTICAVE